MFIPLSFILIVAGSIWFYCVSYPKHRTFWLLSESEGAAKANGRTGWRGHW